MEKEMKKEMNHCPKSLCALFFSILLCLGITSPATSMVVAADEIVVTEVTSTEIVKNEKWVKLEQEVATPQFQIASKTDPEGTAQYLFNKYDGAELFAGGINQRLQNGGWNVYYNTSNGKQTARTAYNGMYVAWSGTGGTASAAAAWAAATGVGWIAAAIFGAVGGANSHFAKFAATCRDQIDSHGNTGTARMTLTEARWSAKYDNRW